MKMAPSILYVPSLVREARRLKQKVQRAWSTSEERTRSSWTRKRRVNGHRERVD